MKVRTKLLVGAALSIATVIALTVAVFATDRQASKAIERSAAAERMLQRLLILNALSLDFVAQNEAVGVTFVPANGRAVEQWQATYAALGTALSADAFGDWKAQAGVVEDIENDLAALEAVFAQMVAIRESEGSRIERDGRGAALEQRLTVQLSLNSQSLNNSIHDLGGAALQGISDTQQKRTVLVLALVGGLTAVFAGTSLTVFLSVVKPVETLTHAVAAVAEGDLNATVTASSKDEIGILGRGFNTMSSHLRETLDVSERHASALVSANERLETEIAERRRAEGEVRRKSEALEQRAQDLARTNTELDAFTYSVSHDLKEPLRTLEAFSGFLLKDYADAIDDQGREYLEKMGKASVRMKSLIEDLLRLSRIGRESKPPRRIDVSSVVSEVAEGLGAAIAEKGTVIEVEEGLPDVLAHHGRIEQLFANLIGNALKFTKDDRPLVKVGARAAEDGMATFYVQDNGIGIDPEYHERIFGVFQRLHRREEYEGTGAGLSIVKRVVEFYGGQVSLESALGAGTTFVFTLPLWTEAAATAEWEAA